MPGRAENLVKLPVTEQFENLEDRVDDLEKRGHPPGGGNMEARISKLEALMEYVRSDIGDIKRDIRLLLGAIIGTALGLAGLMAKGFKWF